jgi:hypothetical protein
MRKLCYIRIMKVFCTALLLMVSFISNAQTDSSGKSNKKPYYRKEEIIYQGKRYAIHNNYLSLGGGYLGSNIRLDVQNVVAVDYQFHIKWLNFQSGAFMSGENFLSNNNTQVHLGYGLRKETNTGNYAVYGGPMYFTGVEGAVGTPAQFFSGYGVYFSAQAIYKIVYDIGFGVEVFGDLGFVGTIFKNAEFKQSTLGVKFIAYFSGAYRGPKRNYNPNVRSESGK